MNSLRLRYGMFWAGRYPRLMPSLREIATTTLALIGLLLAYGIVGRMDYEEALKAEAAASRALASDMEARLLACLNGKSPGLFIQSSSDVREKREFIVCKGTETIQINMEGVKS